MKEETKKQILESAVKIKNKIVEDGVEQIEKAAETYKSHKKWW